MDVCSNNLLLRQLTDYPSWDFNVCVCVEAVLRPEEGPLAMGALMN